MLGTLQNIIRRFDPLPARVSSRSHHAPLAPVVVLLDNPALADEVDLVIAVSGREVIDWQPGQDMPTCYTDILLVSGPDPSNDPISDLIAQGVTVRHIVITDDPTVSDAGPLFLLPGQAADFAACVGTWDRPDCAVYGSVGGAGASTFAAALAGAMSREAHGVTASEKSTPTSFSSGRALLVDAEGDGRLEFVLGLENEPGHRIGALSGSSVVDDSTMHLLPTTGHVSVLTGRGIPPKRFTVECPLVHDCGRWRRDRPALTSAKAVLVVPATVPATLAAREVLASLPGASVVLRTVPRAELSWNDAVTLLGRPPVTTWEDDAFLTGEVDRGTFSPSDLASTTAGIAAGEVVKALW